MKNIKATVSYNGTSYFGWQKTREGPSIEESLEIAFERILQEEVKLQAASRTDRGVHAYGQVVNLFSQKEDLDLSILKRGVQAVLPKDISLISLEFASDAFHPTLDCHSKEYLYQICNSPVQLPFHRDFSWHYPYSLNFEHMQKAAQFLQGKHDFSAFTNQGSEVSENAIREIYSLSITAMPQERLQFSIIGNRFLYKMVRNLVGTIVYIGQGKIVLENLPAILESRDRKLAGITAPAHGLYLNKIFY